MQPKDYPPQEPFNALAEAFSVEVARRGAGINGVEAQFGDDAYQSLAVYPAPKPNGDVLIYQHGGGWTNGYKEWMAFIAPAVHAKGITLVSAGYRLAPAHVFPAAVDDTLAAIAWVHKNIAQHGGDPARIFISGHSAGGHHAALASLWRGWQADYDLPANVLRGCAPVSGVYRFGPDTGAPMRPRFLGATGRSVERFASPHDFIDHKPIPFFISYGTQDLGYLILQAQQFAASLRNAGGQVEMLELDGCNHLQACYACGDIDGPWVTHLATWMRGL
jgi:arylformamidase